MLLLCQQLTAQDVGRMTIDLGGRWSFALDADGAGQAKGYTDRELPDSVTLPGTTDTNGKGYRNDNRARRHISRAATPTRGLHGTAGRSIFPPSGRATR